MCSFAVFLTHACLRTHGPIRQSYAYTRCVFVFDDDENDAVFVCILYASIAMAYLDELRVDPTVRRPVGLRAFGGALLPNIILAGEPSTCKSSIFTKTSTAPSLGERHLSLYVPSPWSLRA